MTELLYFILCSYGLTYILVYAHIFDRIRPNYKFFKCSLCIGFWSGIFIFILNKHTQLFSFDYNFVTAMLLGCLSSGTSYMLSMIIGDGGIRHDRN